MRHQDPHVGLSREFGCGCDYRESLGLVIEPSEDICGLHAVVSYVVRFGSKSAFATNGYRRRLELF
jgi:hypothetical protein